MSDEEMLEEVFLSLETLHLTLDLAEFEEMTRVDPTDV